MVEQSYQELFKIVGNDLIKLGNKKLNEVGEDYYQYFQNYFYEAKLKNPKRYERMFFDTNGHQPFSEELDCILKDFKNSVIETRLYIKDRNYFSKSK
jgi:hypothetical protein